MDTIAPEATIVAVDAPAVDPQATPRTLYRDDGTFAADCTRIAMSVAMLHLMRILCFRFGAPGGVLPGDHAGPFQQHHFSEPAVLPLRGAYSSFHSIFVDVT